jgi:hypothetical protein
VTYDLIMVWLIVSEAIFLAVLCDVRSSRDIAAFVRRNAGRGSNHGITDQ